jgi:hypothetical protein
MPRLRFGFMTLLLLTSIWQFSRGGTWLWAPFLMNALLVALVDTVGPDETSDLSTGAPWAFNLWLFLTLPLLLTMHSALWWMAGSGDALGLGSLLLRLGGPDLASVHASRCWVRSLASFLVSLVRGQAASNSAED